MGKAGVSRSLDSLVKETSATEDDKQALFFKEDNGYPHI